MALGALIALTVAASPRAEKPVKVRVGNLELRRFNGGFTPKALPKNKLAPIALSASGNIKDRRRHPPAGAEGIPGRNRQKRRDQRQGYPICKSGQLQSQDTTHAEAICKNAIIGKGKTDVEIAFPEQAPIPVRATCSSSTAASRAA